MSPNAASQQGQTPVVFPAWDNNIIMYITKPYVISPLSIMSYSVPVDSTNHNTVLPDLTKIGGDQ